MPLRRVLETVLYFDSSTREAMHAFYAGVLGLEPLDADPEAFRLGDGLLLLFNHEESSVKESPPPHGAPSNAHVAFLAPPAEYDEWKARVAGSGTEIVDEIQWPKGPRSFYFRDPAGNVLEIADGDMWPDEPTATRSDRISRDPTSAG